MGGVSGNVLSPIGAVGAVQFLQCGKSTANDFFFICVDPMEPFWAAVEPNANTGCVNMLSIEQW